MACNSKLTASIIADCADIPVKGVISGSKAVIINFSDIDKTASTSSGATITNITTSSTGFALEYYKELASVGGSFAPNTEDIDGFIHEGYFRLPTSSADNAERANEFKAGLFVVVIPTKYQGVGGADAYKVFGWNNGLSLSELTHTTKESGGGMLFTLATPEGAVEPYPYNVFNEGSYSASTASFDTLFINS